jgi:hypothetical protein
VKGDEWADRSEKLGTLEDELVACLATVARYMRPPRVVPRGRALLLAFAAVQRHGEIADLLAGSDYTLRPDQQIPASDVLAISRAMGEVAARVAALESVARGGDLPVLRAALGLNVSQRKAMEKDDAALMVRAVAANLRRVVDAGAAGRKPVHLHVTSVFDAVAGGFGRSRRTVERAWQSGGDSALLAQAQSAWDGCKPAAATVPPAPRPAVKQRKPQDRSKAKATFGRFFQGN